MKKIRTIKKAQLFKDEDIDALMNKVSNGFRLFIQSPLLIQKNKKREFKNVLQAFKFFINNVLCLCRLFNKLNL